MSQFTIEVALMDIKMPGMSGMEVLRQLSVQWPDTCVIMATAVGDAQTAIEAMKPGKDNLKAESYFSHHFPALRLIL